jgi:hypothetical protein
MGDGQPHHVYGLASCSVFAAGRGYSLTVIPFKTMTINHEYVYPVYGMFEIYVFAFNHVSNSSLTVSTVVLDWPCEIPQVTVNPEYTNLDRPIQIKKSENIGIYPNIEINCTSTDAYNSSWIITSGRNTGLSLAASDVLEMAPRTLEYGLYTVNLTVAMYSSHPVLKVDDQRTYTLLYIEIIRSPLHVRIEHDEEYGRKYNVSHTIDASTVTFDPDVADPNDKSGMTFTLFCRREDEEFIQQANGQVSQQPYTPPAGVVRDQYLGYGGCFKDGPGILSATGGSYTFNTSTMIGLTKYIFRVELFKDIRWGFFEQQFFVGPEDPPLAHAVYVSFS